MSRKSANPYDNSHDSFLDIVANLVGILIILVVVVGAQAASEWHKNEENVADYKSQIIDGTKLSKTQAITAANLGLENKELKRKAALAKDINLKLKQQRHWLGIKAEIVERELKLMQSVEMEQAERDRLQAAAEADRLRLKIDNVEMKCNAIRSSITENNETIVHYPTPIAKTVFADEIHFRLLGGKIVHVPLDELVAEMRSEWKVKAKKLESIQNTTETVGPIGKFRLQYELSADQKSKNRDSGRVSVSFERFVVRPVAEGIGETMDVALGPDSEFSRLLQRKTPSKTTVSVWVYPDSFDEFESLKTRLRTDGFQTAGWPLSHGRQISGGPNGFRTIAN